MECVPSEQMENIPMVDRLSHTKVYKEKRKRNELHVLPVHSNKEEQIIVLTEFSLQM